MNRFDRRRFLGQAAGLTALGGSVPGLLAACGGEDGGEQAAEEPRAVVGDVLDFALASDEWEGNFGFVILRLHAGIVDGKEVFFIRTDVSDEEIAKRERLVHVPKIAPLARDGLAGDAFEFEGAAQPAVLSSEPGRDDYTPAWQLHRVRWKSEPRRLRSVAEIEAAERDGDVSVERTDACLNAALVKWSTGSLAVDTEGKEYLGPGQLLEPPDTAAMRVMFKLSQCFPGSRYIVTDHSIEPAAAMTSTVFAPRLQGEPRVGSHVVPVEGRRGGARAEERKGGSQGKGRRRARGVSRHAGHEGGGVHGELPGARARAGDVPRVDSAVLRH